MINLSRGGDDIAYLASPLTGGGIGVTRLSLELFVWARAQGKSTPQDWAQLAWTTLSGLSHNLIKDNKPLETPEENFAEVSRLSELFAKKELPALLALQIA